MQCRISIGIVVIAALVVAAVSLTSGVWIQSAQAAPLSIATPQATLTATIGLTSTPQLQSQSPISASSSTTKLYFGVPAGNGYQPRQIAVDSQRRRAYTLNDGLSDEGGSTISVLDLQKGEVSAFIGLNTGDTYARGLQLDPYRPRLYALGGYYTRSLSIVDTEALTVTAAISDVTACVPAPDRLYLANDTRLWAVDANSLAELAGRTIERRGNQILLLNPQANRLYRTQTSDSTRVEVFAADSLASLGSYTVTSGLKDVLVDAENRRLLTLEAHGDKPQLRALDVDGRPLDTFSPILLNTYPEQAVLDKQTLYFTGMAAGDYRLHGLSLSTLTTTLKSISLPPSPTDLAVDSVTGHLYAVYNSGHYVLEIDPAGGATRSIYTYLKVIDTLIDSTTDRLYLVDNGGTVRILRLSDNGEIAHVETGLQVNYDSFDAPRLSLDAGRHRLYVSGSQLGVVDTVSLTVTARSALAGEVAVDPIGNRIYFLPYKRSGMEDCGVRIIDAESGAEEGILYPGGAKQPPPALGPCMLSVSIDVENRILYALHSVCAGGSSCGSLIYDVFDISGPPRLKLSVSGRAIVFDPVHDRFFVSDMNSEYGNYPALSRIDVRGDKAVETRSVFGAGGGPMRYDPARDRLYIGSSIYDGDLALLSDGGGLFAWADPKYHHYYSASGGNLRITTVVEGDERLRLPFLEKALPPRIPGYYIAPDGTHFRTTAEGHLYRSDDSGQTWQLLGYGLPDWVDTVAVSPDYARDRMLLAGTSHIYSSGGLYRSIDGGQTWRPTTRGLTSLHIDEIVFSPTFARDRTLFVKTRKSGNTFRNIQGDLFRSVDGGDTWVSLSEILIKLEPGSYHPLGHIALSPTFADDGLVFNASEDHLFRSADGGDTWTDTGAPGALVAFSPDFSHDRLIVSASHWRSTDGGQTWQPPVRAPEGASFFQSRLFFSPDFGRDQTVYILMQPKQYAEISLERSADAGRTWQSLAGKLPPGFNSDTISFLAGGKLSFINAADGKALDLDLASLTWNDAPPKK